MSEETKILDEWEKKLEKMIVELNNCQSEKNLKTCTPCSAFFECSLRKKYVIAVYESMNKGSGGGFEF
ncbi:hypothetical protein ACNSOS_00945 [Aliarcobacter vitoriensis]|uniref:hypothetical protein n=1 Tax=Aliarcobacter vitoriensis TaxID=2011099 RepID=UPI003AABF054